MTIGLRSVAKRPHRVTLQNPGPAVPWNDEGTVQTWVDMVPPSMSVSIEPATAETLERARLGTIISTATHVISGPYHPQLATRSRILFNGRVFNVTGVANPEERNVESIAVCVEVVL
jgi:head-tail adaptor